MLGIPEFNTPTSKDDYSLFDRKLLNRSWAVFQKSCFAFAHLMHTNEDDMHTVRVGVLMVGYVYGMGACEVEFHSRLLFDMCSFSDHAKLKHGIY